MPGAVPPEDIQLRIRSNPRLLSAVRGLVRGYLDNLGLNPEQRDTVVLAVDEACTNAIRHAYQGRDDASIDLRLWTDPDAVVIELEDHGRPADAARLAPRDLTPPAQAELKPGGLGVQFIRQAFDDVVYHSEPHGGNKLTMRLHHPQDRALRLQERVQEEDEGDTTHGLAHPER